MTNTASAADNKISVLITGIGAGSLGLEVCKALRPTKAYRLIGTDISAMAYGFYEEGFDSTYLLRNMPSREYAEQLLAIALKEKVDVIAPGAEEVHRILAANRGMFEEHNILLMLNTPHVIELCADKSKTMAFLKSHNISVPVTQDISSEDDVKGFSSYPCIVKPASLSGGSNLVCIAEDEEEAVFFIRYLKKRGYDSTLQEYILSHPHITVVVLKSPSGEILGSIAVER